MAENTSFRDKLFRDFPTSTFPSYADFSKTYEMDDGADGWERRRVYAIPNFLFAMTLKPIYHIGMAVLTLAGSLYKAVMKSEEVSKAFNTIDQDLYEAWGHLTTLFNDQYGRYFTEASQYQKEQNQKKSESTDEEAQTTVAPPPAAPAPPPAAPPINPDLLAAVRRPANRPLRRVNSNPDLHSAEREEWKPLSIQDIMAQRDRILAEKRSDQEREPEVGTPVKGELTDVLSRRMNEVRARVTLSPQKPPSQTPKHMVGAGATPTRLSKGMAPKDDTPRTKYLARKEGAKGRPPTSWGGAGESSSEESEDSHDWS